VSKENHGIDVEKELLGNIAKGEDQAFWELWPQYRDYIYRVCLRQMRGNAADAEDALSEIMLKALRKLPEHAPKVTNFKGWLARLATNHCIDIHRSRSRRETQEIGPDEFSQSGMPEPAADFYLPETSPDRTDERLAIHGLTAALSEAFIARFAKEKSYSEIAQLLNISAACARKRVQRALEIIRRQLPPDTGAAAFAGAAFVLGEESSRTDRPATRRLLRRTSEAPVTMLLVTAHLPDGTEADFLAETYSKRLVRPAEVRNLRRYVRRHPSGWKKRLDLARCFHLLGDWQIAAQEYERVLRRHPCREVWLEFADLQRRSQRLPEARAAYSSALRCPGQASDDHYIQAQIALSGHKYQAAEDLLQQSVLLQPKNARAAYTLLNLLHQSQRPFDLLATCDAWLAIHPDDRIGSAYRSMSLEMLQMHHAAYQNTRLALEKDAGNPLLLRQAVRHHCERQWLKGDQGKQTRAWIRKMLKLFPRAADTHEALAHYHIARGNWETGIQVLSDFVAEHPRHPHGWMNLAIWLSKTGDLDGAIEAIFTACADSEGDAKVYAAATEILAHAGRFDAIPFVVDSMLAQPAQCWTKWSAAAQAVVLLPDQEGRAMSLSLQATSLQPQLPEVWWRHGQVLRSASDPRQAITAFHRALNLVFADTEKLLVVRIYVALAEAYQAVGNQDAACFWAQKAQVTLDGSQFESAECHYLRGLSCICRGDRDAGLQAFLVALRHRPYYPTKAKIELVLRSHRIRSGRPGLRTKRHEHFPAQAEIFHLDCDSRECG
jgi:RNA polymerase sigma factor (sigma-70 family)